MVPSFEDVKVAQSRLLRNTALDLVAGANLFIKAECLQETGSFKLRGATNRLLQIPEGNRENGVVAFSSGNHAQGIARAAAKLKMPALIVMPSDAPKVKVEGVVADGAEIRFYDRETESRETIAADLAQQRGAVLVPSFDDAMIIAGQGTCGFELAEQMKSAGKELDHLVCCAGGGGLISGIVLAFEGLSPETRIWTAEPEGHADWAASLQAGKIVRNAPGTRSICDAILTPQPGDLTWAIGSRLLTGGCVVSDEQVLEAMRGGAAALAAALFALPEAAKGKTVGVILTGANVDAEFYADVLSGRV